jgi:phage-related holin
MHKMTEDLGEAFIDLFTRGYAIIGGAIGFLLAYFLPIKMPIYVIVCFFVLDIIYGYKSAKIKGKLDGINVKFEPRIIWAKTIPKMIAAFMLIITAHMLDTITPVEIVTIKQTVAYVVAGLVLSSVWKNAMYVTKWTAIKQVVDILTDKIKKNKNEEK